MKKYLFHTYYKDDDGGWHQPGTKGIVSDAEGDLLIKRGHAKMIETMTISQPETRIRGKRNVKRKI